MDGHDGPVDRLTAHGAGVVDRARHRRSRVDDRRQASVDAEPGSRDRQGLEALLGEGRLPEVDALESLESGDGRHRSVPHLAAVEVQDLQLLHGGEVGQPRSRHGRAGEVEAAQLPEAGQLRQAGIGDRGPGEVQPDEAGLESGHRCEGIVPGGGAQQGEVGVESVEVARHGQHDRAGGRHTLQGRRA